MKISYVSVGAPIPSIFANSIATMENYNALSMMGFEVNLIIPSDTKRTTKIENEKEIWDFYGLEKSFSITRIPSKYFYKFGVLGRNLFRILMILIGIWKRSEILFVRHVELGIIAALLGRNVVVELHVIAEIKNLTGLQILASLSKKRNILFITTTQSGFKRLLSLGIEEKKILIAPSSVNLKKYNFSSSKSDLRKRLGLPLNKSIVMYTGNLYKDRGVEELIEAMQYLPNLLLIIIGGNLLDINRCKTFVEMNKQENIVFIGHVLHRKIPAYLQSADMLVMPYTTNLWSLKDMSPLKMFEYMASGSPIIASDFPVLREILTNKVNAIMVKPDNPNSISKGIQWLVDNPEMAISIAQQAKKDVEDFTYVRRAEKIAGWLKLNFKGLF